MFSGIGVTLIHDDGFIAAIVLMSVGVVLSPMMSTSVTCVISADKAFAYGS